MLVASAPPHWPWLWSGGLGGTPKAERKGWGWRGRRSKPEGFGQPAATNRGDWTNEESNKVCALHSTEDSTWSLLHNPGDLEAAEEPQHLADRTVEAGSKLIGMNRILGKEPRQLPLLGRKRLR
jgi:hypothetical protein